MQNNGGAAKGKGGGGGPGGGSGAVGSDEGGSQQGDCGCPCRADTGVWAARETYLDEAARGPPGGALKAIMRVQ